MRTQLRRASFSFTSGSTPRPTASREPRPAYAPDARPRHRRHALFTLSGFLLYRPFAAALVRSTSRPSFGAYFGIARSGSCRRTSRSSCCPHSCSAVFVRTESGDLAPQDAPGFGWLLKNLTLTRNCTPSGVITGIAPAWSLAVEVVFYLMLPALVLIGSHRHTRGKADHHEITFGAGAATLSFSFLDSLARPRPPSSVQARTTAGERTGARSWSGASFAMGISSPLGWPSPYSTPRSKTAYYE